MCRQIVHASDPVASGIRGRLGEAEIDDLHLQLSRVSSTARQHDIAGLQVPMDQTVGRRSRINGQLLPVGFAQSLTAGNMSFGSVLVTLRNSSRSDDGNAHVDGVLGLDVLTRYKAVINCRTKVIFFKVDPTRQMHLSGVAASEKFTRVSMRQKENGAP